MALSSKQLKALNWYITEHKLRPQLSTPPVMYFKDSDGTEVTTDLSGIVKEYEYWNEEDKKARATARKIIANKNKQNMLQ